MQELLTLRQHAASTRSHSPAATQLRTLALAGLTGLNASSFLDNTSHGHVNGGGNGVGTRQYHDENEGVLNNLSVTQRLLALQQQQHHHQQQQHSLQQQQLGGNGVNNADAQALDALGLLARSAPRSQGDNHSQGQFR